MEHLETFDREIPDSMKEMRLNGDAEIYLQQVDGGNPERWAQMSIEEKINSVEMFDTRFNEIMKLQNNRPSVCVDSPLIANNSKLAPLVEQYLTMRENNPKYFEAPGDVEQIQTAVEQLKGIENLKPENWERLTKEERISVMQQVENVMAEISHREPCPIVCQSMEGNLLGFYSQRNRTITLREDILMSNNSEAYKINFDTIIHEGRHAYQHYNMTVREVHPNHAAVEEWGTNSKNYESGESSIFDFKRVGMRLYWNQPVEYDARIFAGEIQEKLYKEWKI